MGQLATDVTNEVADITTCGDEINFPKYDRVASVGNVTKGVALVPASVSMTENKATIKQTGGAVRIFDKDEKQIKGATLDNMAQQLVDAIVQDLDSSLSATMDTEATKKSPTASATAITFDEVMDLFYSLRAPYRRQAVFMMNDSTVKVLRKLKNGAGDYIWQPSTTLVCTSMKPRRRLPSLSLAKPVI